jgi:hypothetical protein
MLYFSFLYTGLFLLCFALLLLLVLLLFLFFGSGADILSLLG